MSSSSPLRIAIAGASGRMGRMLIEAVLNAPDCQLAGALDIAGNPALGLDAEGLERFEALKAWRSEVAKEHGLPAYVIFQNTTLAEMARVMPGDLDELGEISGVGAKKLEAYGREILRVLGH